jgi:hypothetical protein
MDFITQPAPADVPPVYSLGSAAHLTGVQPEVLRHYCQLGLLGEDRTSPNSEPVFDHAALDILRRIELYRHHYGINPLMIPLAWGPVGEVGKLQDEIRIVSVRKNGRENGHGSTPTGTG